MKHLTVEELIDFVSARQLDADYLSLAARVTEHVRRCDSCLGRLNAFQLVSDGLKGSITTQAPREAVAKRAACGPASAENAQSRQGGKKNGKTEEQQFFMAPMEADK